MKMEFPTLEELEESGAKFLYYTNSSVIGEIFEHVVENETINNLKQQQKYYIYTITNTGNLYISKNGKPTYSKLNAHLFLLEDAKKKVFYMNKNGKRIWKYAI